MKRLMVLGCILILSCALSSCRTVRGGGWIESASGDGKATFGVNLINENSEIHGKFTYHDNGVKGKMPDGKMHKFAIKAWIEPCEFDAFTSGTSTPDSTSWYFNYVVQPDKFGISGTGVILFSDANLTDNPNDKDVLSIKILTMTGPAPEEFQNYSNEGELGGGNLVL